MMVTLVILFVVVLTLSMGGGVGSISEDAASWVVRKGLVVGPTSIERVLEFNGNKGQAKLNVSNVSVGDMSINVKMGETEKFEPKVSQESVFVSSAYNTVDKIVTEVMRIYRAEGKARFLVMSAEDSVTGKYSHDIAAVSCRDSTVRVLSKGGSAKRTQLVVELTAKQDEMEDVLKACVGEYRVSGIVEPDIVVQIGQADEGNRRRLSVSRGSNKSDVSAVGSKDEFVPVKRRLQTISGNEEAAGTVCVVDTGIDRSLEDVLATTADKSIDGFDADRNTSAPWSSFYHGTEVAKLTRQLWESRSRGGPVNQRVKVIPCKFTNKRGKGWISNAIRCIDFCTVDRQSPPVISLAWFYAGEGLANLSEAILRARSANSLIVSSFCDSTGRSGGERCGTASDAKLWPQSYQHDNILRAASIDVNHQWMWVDNGMVQPDIAALGDASGSSTKKYGYSTKAGFAAARVAATASQIEGDNSSYQKVKALILSSAETTKGKRVKVLDAAGAVIMFRERSLFVRGIDGVGDGSNEGMKFNLKESATRDIDLQIMSVAEGSYWNTIEITYSSISAASVSRNVISIPVHIVVAPYTGRRPPLPPPLLPPLIIPLIPPPPPPPPFPLPSPELFANLVDISNNVPGHTTPTTTTTASIISTTYNTGTRTTRVYHQAVVVPSQGRDGSSSTSTLAFASRAATRTSTAAVLSRTTNEVGNHATTRSTGYIWTAVFTLVGIIAAALV